MFSQQKWKQLSQKKTIDKYVCYKLPTIQLYAYFNMSRYSTILNKIISTTTNTKLGPGNKILVVIIKFS